VASAFFSCDALAGFEEEGARVVGFRTGAVVEVEGTAVGSCASVVLIAGTDVDVDACVAVTLASGTGFVVGVANNCGAAAVVVEATVLGAGDENVG